MIYLIAGNGKLVHNIFSIKNDKINLNILISQVTKCVPVFANYYFELLLAQMKLLVMVLDIKREDMSELVGLRVIIVLHLL